MARSYPFRSKIQKHHVNNRRRESDGKRSNQLTTTTNYPTLYNLADF